LGQCGLQGFAFCRCCGSLMKISLNIIGLGMKHLRIVDQ
jgi:hypothetical protein